VSVAPAQSAVFSLLVYESTQFTDIKKPVV